MLHSRIAQATVLGSRYWAMSGYEGQVTTEEEARNGLRGWREHIAENVARGDSEDEVEKDLTWLRSRQAEYRILRLARMLDEAMEVYAAADAALVV